MASPRAQDSTQDRAPPSRASASRTTVRNAPASAARAPRWARRKDSRPAELLEAALSLFLEHGYADTRLDEVAARAGVSKGTLYLYFANKEELFKAVIRDSIVPLIQAFERSLHDSEESCAQQLARFLRQWWLCFGATRLAGIARLMFAEAGKFPDLARFFHQEVITRDKALMAGIVRRGIARGEFRALEVEAACHLWMAPLLLRALSAHSLDQLTPGETPMDDEHFLNTHLELVLRSAQASVNP